MTIKRSQWPHSSTLYSCILFIECCQWTRSTSDLFSIVVSVVYNVYYIRRENPFRAPINLYRHSINAIRMFAVTLKLQYNVLHYQRTLSIQTPSSASQSQKAGNKILTISSIIKLTHFTLLIILLLPIVVVCLSPPGT